MCDELLHESKLIISDDTSQNIEECADILDGLTFYSHLHLEELQ